MDNNIFKALSSETRVKMLKSLIKKENHISGLARDVGVSVPVASKHVDVLERAELVTRVNFGRTHVIKAIIENLQGMESILKENHTIGLEKGLSITDALKQIPGIDVEKVGNKSYIASIDGEKGYYIYEIDGEAPNIPIDEYILERDTRIEIKKLFPVDRKTIDVRCDKTPDK